MLEPVFWPFGVNVGCGTDGPLRFHADAKPVSTRLPPPKLTLSELPPPPTWVALLNVPEPPVTKPVVAKPFAVSVTAPAPALIVPGVSVVASVRWRLPPPAVTAPVSVFAAFSTIAPAPACRLLVPLTAIAPVCVMLPPLLVELSAPLIVPVPRFRAPVLTVVSAAVFTVPSVKAFASVIDVAPLVRLTALWKSFAAVKVTVWPAALMVVTPPTVIAPVWLTAPALVLVKLQHTVSAPKLVVPPAVVVVVSDAPTAPLTTRLPPATSVSEPVLVSVAVSAFTSTRSMVEPVAVTAPVKSLPAFVSDVALAPELIVTAPAPAAWTKAPVCVSAPPLLVIATMRLPTLEAARISPPVASVIATLFAPLLLSVTAPTKSFAEVRVIDAAPAVMLDVPVTVNAPDSETAPALEVATRLPPTVP